MYVAVSLHFNACFDVSWPVVAQMPSKCFYSGRNAAILSILLSDREIAGSAPIGHIQTTVVSSLSGTGSNRWGVYRRFIGTDISQLSHNVQNFDVKICLIVTCVSFEWSSFSLPKIVHKIAELFQQGLKLVLIFQTLSSLLWFSINLNK